MNINKQRFIKIGKIVGIMTLLLVSFTLGSVMQTNSDQLQIYDQALNHNSQPTSQNTNSSSLNSYMGTTISLTNIVHYTIGHGLSAGADNYSRQLISEGYIPDCVSFCLFGINYAQDPTVLITNNGHDFEQCKVFGSAGTITCTSADIAQYVSVSVSSAYTPTATDSSCHATVQTTDGYSVIAGTITAGAAGTTVTTTISHTWTDATAGVNSIDLACIQTEATGGGNIVLYAEGQIASTSTNIGDSLTTQWQISRT